MDSAELLDVDDDAMSLDDAALAFAHAEFLIRRLQAKQARIAARIEETGHWTVDGHRTMRQWVSATINCSPAVATQHVHRARVARQLPKVTKRWSDGDIGGCQIDELARLLRNPRAGHQLTDSEELLLEQAQQLRYHDFTVVTARWLAYADPDGNIRSHDDARKQRTASSDFVGSLFRFRADGDTLTGTEMNDIFGHFTTGEFLADCDHAKQIYGPNITKNQLARTHAQRAYDALLTIFRTAAAAGTAHVKPFTPDVGIVVDHATYETTLRHLLGDDNAPWPNPADVLKLRCETHAGIPVDPRAAVIATLTGRVRQIVMDQTGHITRYGRSQRTFPDHIARMIRIRDRHCTWLTCPVHANHCETDHIIPWARGGLTDLENGDCDCGYHNRFKNRGYTVTRDQHGTWHHYRPDGTEVCPLDINPEV